MICSGRMGRRRGRCCSRCAACRPIRCWWWCRPAPGELPRLGEGWQRFLAGDHRAGRVRLGGLGPEEVVALGRALGAGELPRRAVSRLLEETGGNPLYCRAVLEEAGAEGRDRRRDAGGAALAGRGGAVAGERAEPGGPGAGRGGRGAGPPLRAGGRGRAGGYSVIRCRRWAKRWRPGSWPSSRAGPRPGSGSPTCWCSGPSTPI